MKLSELKTKLSNITEINFKIQSTGNYVPKHFHVTEVGIVEKKFIDCGGVVRNEQSITLQLWEANDTDHRLLPDKLLKIIQKSEETIGLSDVDVEVEYQQDTIGIFKLGFDGDDFVLQNKYTACLAEDACGIPKEKMKLNLSQIGTNTGNSCTPGSGCCN